MKGHGHIEIARFHPICCLVFFLPILLEVTDSELNLNLSFEAKGQEMFQAAIEGTVSKLTLRRGVKKLSSEGGASRGLFS